jgi:tetratricopeptide (TPR) repeat protein
MNRRTLRTLGITTLLLACLAAAPALPAQTPEEEAANLIQRALVEVEQGNLEGAIALLEPARQGNPPNELRAVLGTLYVEAGRAEDALAVLGPVAEAEDANAAVLYNAGRAAIATGDAERGQTYLERSLTLEPGTPAIRELGLLYGLQGRIRDAYRLLMPWLEQNPDDPQARRAAALAALRLGRLPTAERLLADVPQTRPADKMLWGHLLLLKGDPHGAISLLAPLLASADGLPAQLDHDVRWVLAESYVQVGEAEVAVGVLTGVAGDAPSMLLLGRAQYQSGDLEGALATLQPLAEPIVAQQHDRSDPRWGVATEIAREYGRWLVAAGRHDEAIPYLEIATEMEPNRKETWQALGQALAAAGRQEEARSALEEFQRLAQEAGGETEQIERMRLSREDPTAAAMDRAQRLVGEGKAEEALAEVRAEAQLAPEDLRPRLFEAWLLLSMDRADEALRLSEVLLRGVPDNPDVLHQRGAAMMAVDRTVEAEADFRRALELNPGHVPT